jgi:retron-type reverse transcriptase
LDVQSLFTSIPINETLNIIKTRFNIASGLHKLIEICFTSTYFTFDNNIYEQTEGTAMGSPLSPFVADIFMEELENNLLEKSRKKPKLFARYVDDIFMIWKHRGR